MGQGWQIWMGMGGIAHFLKGGKDKGLGRLGLEMERLLLRLTALKTRRHFTDRQLSRIVRQQRVRFLLKNIRSGICFRNPEKENCLRFLFLTFSLPLFQRWEFLKKIFFADQNAKKGIVKKHLLKIIMDKIGYQVEDNSYMY